MITYLRLRNFKGYRDSQRIPLAPLTVLVGPNNSGKSSIIHSLLLLRQTIQDRESGDALITSGPLVDLGSYHEILRGGRESGGRTMGIELGIDMETARHLSRGFATDPKDRVQPANLSLTFAFDNAADRIVVSRLVAKDQEGGTTAEVRRSGGGHWSPTIDEAARTYVQVRFNHFFPVLMFGHDLPKEMRHMLFEGIEAFWGLSSVWSGLLEGIRYIGPIRSPVPRYNLRGRTASHQPGSGGEQLQRLVRSSTTEDASDRLVEAVDEWVSKRFGFLERLRVVSVDPDGAIRSLVGDERGGFAGINIANMGEGLSQFLPIVAEAEMTRPRDLLVVEQPEIHLHPKAQSDLGDLFVHQVSSGKDVQCIVETHSEHLLLRIRRRVAEGVLPPEAVSVLYVERVDGESNFRRLDLNDRGHFADWPDGFFEEGYEEALRLAEAASKRAGSANE